MENYREVASLQLIQPDGAKRFLRGGRAGGCVFRLGSGREMWWCEGLATGLSVLAALEHLYRRARVTVCFSAGNLAKVARKAGYGVVVADHDPNSQAGEKAAQKTGLRWWMPTEPGDANDYHQRRGVQALAKQLQEVLTASRKAA